MESLSPKAKNGYIYLLLEQEKNGSNRNALTRTHIHEYNENAHIIIVNQKKKTILFNSNLISNIFVRILSIFSHW